jgi:hypothetical protein
LEIRDREANCRPHTQALDPLLVCPLQAEADELCSFVVGKKGNKQWQWLWLALDAHSRQVLTFHVGGRCPKMIFSSLFSEGTQEEQATRMRDKAGPLRTSDDLSFGIPDLQ